MIQLTVQGLDRFRGAAAGASDSLHQKVIDAMSQSVNEVKNAAQKLAPYKTGTLRRSIQTDILSGGLQGVVYQDYDIAKYGPMMEYGTAAHEILPVNKQALFWQGALNPYKRVMHPGTSPRPYMNPAFQQSKDKINKFFTDAIGKVIIDVAGKA